MIDYGTTRLWAWVAAAAALSATAGAGFAQQCDGGLPAFASIGVGQFECIGGPCSVNLRDGAPYRHSFATEPRLRQIDRSGPGRDAIRDGDVLVAVDGRLITTSEGGAHLGSLTAGSATTLTLRRDGGETERSVTPVRSCDLPGLIVRGREGSAYAIATGADARAVVSGSGQGWGGAEVAAQTAYREALRGAISETNARVAGLGRTGQIRPTAELGVEMRCGDCGFRLLRGDLVFETDVFPTVVSVEEGGPGDSAGMLVGDVILTVADRVITAGRTLGALRVGEATPLEVRRGDRIIELNVIPRAPGAPRQRW